MKRTSLELDVSCFFFFFLSFVSACFAAAAALAFTFFAMLSVLSFPVRSLQDPMACVNVVYGRCYVIDH